MLLTPILPTEPQGSFLPNQSSDISKMIGNRAFLHHGVIFSIFFSLYKHLKAIFNLKTWYQNHFLEHANSNNGDRWKSTIILTAKPENNETNVQLDQGQQYNFQLPHNT